MKNNTKRGGSRPGSGRKRFARLAVIQMKIEAAEKARYKAAAAAEKRPLSVWIREACLERLTRSGL